VRFGLRDLSAALRKTDESRDWSAPAVFTYAVVCDKSQPEKSLLHGIAQRAGLSVSDIDCATIPLTLPYVKLTRNVWAELSDLAKTYRCHVECAPEKPLVFAHSPYQSETQDIDDCSYTFGGNDIFYLRTQGRTGDYRNTVRLKINLPVALEKQEIWRYEDAPVMYDDSLLPRYPFRDSLPRAVTQAGYEARYSIRDTNGVERSVVFASEVDTKEQAETRLSYEGGSLRYETYDVTSHHDKAILSLAHDGDCDLYVACIYGKPIVLDLNRSCFLRDTDAVSQFGTVALNVTGSYFSEDLVGGKPQYEDWTMRELSARLNPKREITVKTQRGVFHGRVGAAVRIATQDETMIGTVTGFSFRCRKERAFEASYSVIEN
jgi:hypothetical protein